MASIAATQATSATISEKTVELNLTIEIVNYMSHMRNYAVFAWGPTLRQEASFGFDAAYGLKGHFIYIQYKRANVEGSGHLFHLNRTSSQDQHKKLLSLEANGVAVRYALPRFTTLGYVETNRRRLLVPPHTAWLRPSQIQMPNGGVGHHDLHIHANRRWLTSDPIELDAPDDNPFLDSKLERLSFLSDNNIEKWSAIFSEIFGDDEEVTQNAAIIFIKS